MNSKGLLSNWEEGTSITWDWDFSLGDVVSVRPRGHNTVLDFRRELGLEMWTCFSGKRRNLLRFKEKRDWGKANRMLQEGSWKSAVSRRPGKVFPRGDSDQQCQMPLMLSERRADNWPWYFEMWRSLVILTRMILVELMRTKTWLERFKRGIGEIRDFFFFLKNE